jgi:hypothetical protein
LPVDAKQYAHQLCIRPLEAALKAKRVDDVERWDVAVAIWRRFGGTIGADGIRDERVLLDSRDAAIAYTLFARAALSEDPKDDLLAGALHELEDSRLQARSGEPGRYRGLSTHKLVSFYVWPSLEAGRKEEGPIGEEEAKLRNIYDADARLERFLAVGETAYEAVTGDDFRVGEPAPSALTKSTARVSTDEYCKLLLTRLLTVQKSGEMRYLTSTALAGLGPLPEGYRLGSFKSAWATLRTELTKTSPPALRIADDAPGHRTHPAEFVAGALEPLEAMLKDVMARLRSAQRS